MRCVYSDHGSLTLDVPPPSETSAWRAVARVLRSPLDTVGCALLPAGCVLCGSPLPHFCSVPICDACWIEFPVQSAPVCSRCGDVLTIPEAVVSSPTCRVCRLAPPAFVRAVACGPYEGRMRDAIHVLKYERLHSAARPLGTMLAKTLGQLVGEAPAEMLVVPVPLHRSKRKQRGFNQSRLLADCALAALRHSHPAWRLKLAASTVLRLRATASQASLTPRQRRSNVRGAFRVADPEAVRSKHILVIDDIFTTGATARSVAQELRRAGAASVWIGTVARARLYFKQGRVAKAGQAKKAGDASGLPGADALSASMYSSSRQPSF